MFIKTVPKLTLLLVILISLSQLVSAQSRTIIGKVTDPNGVAIPGVTVTVKGTTTSTQTTGDGTFKISAPDNATLVFSSIGYNTFETGVSGRTTVDVNMAQSSNSLGEVVVIGYGTSRRKDQTGAVSSVQAKDFNKGVVVNPDQLLQGKVAGLQIVNNSGQPGAATVVQIRGNNSIRSGNTPLYVIDGVPLDGRSPRPGLFNNTSGVGTTPDINPLNFVNPSEILRIDILKDASSAAIYGSRGANGVILVTTKHGIAGPPQLEVGASFGISDVMRKIKVLDASGYRSALKSYSAPASDSGATVDPFKEILHENAPIQNYNLALSGGNENSKYRASFYYSDQQGIIKKSSLKKFVVNFNGQNTWLDKKLSFDYLITAANLAEHIAPISNDAGSNGNLISLAMIWNPTLALKRSNGVYNQANPSGQVNPLALSDAYNDQTSLTTLLGSFSVGYKITQDLQYKFLYGINYGTGLRWQELQGWIKGTGSNADGQGLAGTANAQLLSQTITHTLSYVKQLSSNFNLNALVGYEYWTTSYKGGEDYVYGFNLNLDQASVNPNYHYYDNMQAGNQANLRTASFKDPTVDLQSYFGRVEGNYRDKYIVTATLRADGSSKFGENNKYGYFPSVGVSWNIHNEDFFKSQNIFNTLKLRVGYGITGNQEFHPVDAALPVGIYSGYNTINAVHFGNPDLKWEQVASVDAGLDFSMFHNRLFAIVDYYNKKTNDPILDFVISQPTAGTGTVYKNMDGTQAQKGWVSNKGVEVTLGGAIIQKSDLVWNMSVNFTSLKNSFESDDPSLKSVPFIKNTGALHGQGSSGAYSEVIAAGQPIDVFYLPEFKGFNQSGIGQYGAAPIFAGNPNPTVYLGFSTDLTVKKWTFVLNAHGSFGNKIFNNTAMSVLNINNIIGGRNIASNLVGNGESTANAITPSTRFLESGDYMKLGNATVSYRFGKIGRYIKNAFVYVAGTNLFVITKYNGFDPEVNVDKNINGVPSLGVDYIGYPTARTYTIGINFSLQ
jgi:iron complex outermembrane receptor protein